MVPKTARFPASSFSHLFNFNSASLVKVTLCKSLLGTLIGQCKGTTRSLHRATLLSANYNPAPGTQYLIHARPTARLLDIDRCAALITTFVDVLRGRNLACLDRLTIKREVANDGGETEPLIIVFG